MTKGHRPMAQRKNVLSLSTPVWALTAVAAKRRVLPGGSFFAEALTCERQRLRFPSNGAAARSLRCSFERRGCSVRENTPVGTSGEIWGLPPSRLGMALSLGGVKDPPTTKKVGRSPTLSAPLWRRRGASLRRRLLVTTVLTTSLFALLWLVPESAVAAAAAAATKTGAEGLMRPLGTFRVLPTLAELEISFRLLFAALGGASVGIERSQSDRPAGVRTMALVSLGAAAFTLCSMYGFLTAASLSESTKYDPSRMASNVASGVGFIGAGVITNNRKAAGVYDRKSTVGGLTTAAAIWTSAAIGVASGVGLYFISFVATVSTITILRFGKVKNGNWGKRLLSSGTKQRRKAAVAALESNEADAQDISGSDLNVTATPLGSDDVTILGDNIAAQRHVWDLHNQTRSESLLDEISKNKVTVDDENNNPELNQLGAGRDQELANLLLAKHIWGLNNTSRPSSKGDDAFLPPGNPTRHSIEEKQEIIRE